MRSGRYNRRQIIGGSSKGLCAVLSFAVGQQFSQGRADTCDARRYKQLPFPASMQSFQRDNAPHYYKRCDQSRSDKSEETKLKYRTKFQCCNCEDTKREGIAPPTKVKRITLSEITNE